MAYRLNSSNVVNDTIDGEVLAIRSDTGAYYSMQGASATAWCALISGGDADIVARSVADHHTIDFEVARAALSVFGAELDSESLLIEGPCEVDVIIELPRETKGTHWETPRFEKYTDMQDLLLFDPIHEVDPSGWPKVDRNTT